MSNLEESLISSWEKLQLELREKVISKDTEYWAEDVEQIDRIGGIDISYDKLVQSKACVTAVVLDAKNDFKCIYSNNCFVTVNTPYVAGFLAFREMPFLVNQIEILKKNFPKLLPQVWLIDGNGTLHSRQFGLACHLGVLVDVPVIGVAKNPYYLNTISHNAKDEHKKQLIALKNVGDWIPIYSQNNEIIGAAVKTSSNCKNPVYVSIGHRVSLKTAINVVLKSCKYKIPEPIRHSDFLSREQIRNQNVLK